jgi:hypothetical protein
MDESVVKVFEQQHVGTLRLSDAIRIGAKLRPQCTYEPFDKVGRSCALGAAYEATFGRTGDVMEVYGTLPYRYPALLRQLPSSTKDIMSEIFERNDQWHNTREQIADWLEAQGY